MAKFKIGIDGGGSKTHAVIINENYYQIDEIITGPANIKTDIITAIKSITEAINYLMNKYNLNYDTEIGIGVAGFSDKSSLKILDDILKQTYSKITLTSDAHIACLAAHSGNNGGVIICGTGVVGYSILNGTGTQIGGWGFPHGDIGGGAWIGLELCRLLCKAIDHTYEFSPLLQALLAKFNNCPTQYKLWLLNAKPQDYAEIAALLPEHLLQEDVNALQIVQSGANELSSLITAMQQENIAITGGLAALYHPYLQTAHPNLKISTTHSAIGACYLFTK